MAAEISVLRDPAGSLPLSKKQFNMKRIAITGPDSSEGLLVAKALSIMCGYDLSISPSFSHVAFKYGLNTDIEACQWPDSYLYCLEAFTERIIVKQQYGDRMVSDGSVLSELVWLKCRYPHVDLICEQSMIRTLERVFASYAAKNYGVIFHLSALSGTGVEKDCLRALFETYHIPCRTVASPDRESALQEMAAHLQITPVMNASCSLARAERELNFKQGTSIY
jgi:hypothetical protein